MAEPNLQLNVDGHWLSLEFLLGELSMSTVWPGGSDEASWTLGKQSWRRFSGGELVTGYFGPVPVFAGTLVEPDPSQDQLTAQGLWRLGDKWPALTAGGLPATAPNGAVDNAILRGLQWVGTTAISGSSVAIDVSEGPVSVAELLDTYAVNNTTRWAVDATGQVYSAPDETLPTYQTLPLNGGLGYALDNYASTLICRYFDSATSTFKTLPAVTDAAAERDHGHVEVVVDLTDRGPITSVVATNIANSLLALGRSTPQWMTDIEVSYGELLSMGGTPVALETVAAGKVLRVWGGDELAQRKNGQMYVDVLIGNTTLSGGTLVLRPLQRATRSYQDFVTDAMSKKRGDR